MADFTTENEDDLTGLLGQVADESPTLLWLCDKDGKSLWFNQRWLEFTGQELAAAVSLGRIESIHVDDREHVSNAFETAATLRQTLEVEYRLRHASGNYVWVLERCAPRFDKGGQFVGFAGCCNDVSNERSYRQRLVQRDRILRRLHELCEQEKAYMSASIHDGLLQDIIGVEMLLQGLENLPTNELAPRVAKARASLRSALSHGRRLIGELRPATIDEPGLLRAIEMYAAEVETRSGISIQVTNQVTTDLTFAIWEGNVFRIVQEVLNNVEVHSHATAASILLRPANGLLHIKIRDNGKGFDLETTSDSTGLRCIRDRAEIYGGKAQIRSQLGKETVVEISIPAPIPIS